MRISDWSSDVCSSDLSGAPHPFRYGDIRDEVLDYEEELAKHVYRVPEILESYYANLVGGAYSEMRSEAPARYADDVAKFPERRVEFWNSAFSWRIGAPCYTSCESWLIPEIGRASCRERVCQYV